MATTPRTRKTIEEQIAAAEELVKKLKTTKKERAKKKDNKLTKESVGIADAIIAIEAAAKENKCNLADVIKAIAGIKRTGLKIENAVRKPKA